jgi:hypothetical protein
MARKISGGAVGEPSVGAIQVAPTANITSANGLDITVSPVGAARFLINGNAQVQNQGDLRFGDSDSSNYVGFQAPSAISVDTIWTLPATDGTASQILTTNGSGTLSWTNKNVTITSNTIDSNINYIVFTTATTGDGDARVSNTGLTFQPSTGTLTVTNIVESSSITFKENVSPINNALDDIMKLVGVTYDRKDGSAKGEAGLIAEWVDDILPNLVTKDHLGKPLGINYTKFSAYLIEAVKTLKNEIDELKKK